jgi:hypothetical protein
MSDLTQNLPDRQVQIPVQDAELAATLGTRKGGVGSMGGVVSAVAFTIQTFVFCCFQQETHPRANISSIVVPGPT